MNKSLLKQAYLVKNGGSAPNSSGEVPYLSQSEEEPYRRSRSSRPQNVASSQILPKTRFHEIFGKKSGHTERELSKDPLPSISKNSPVRLLPVSSVNNSSKLSSAGKSRGKPTFSDARLLQGVGDIPQTDRLGELVHKHKDKLLKLLSNDSSLPKILTSTKIQRGVGDDTERPSFSKNSINNLSHLTPKKYHLFQKVPQKERPIKMEYYLKKIEIAASLPHAVLSQGFLDHFQKNYADLKSAKNDKLIMDYHLKQVQLPPSVHEHLLVLDLDETLVHCCNFDQKTNSNTVTLPLKNPHGVYQGMIRFNVRPGVEKFLKTMGEHFQIVVFTASDRQYAKTVLDYIDHQQAVCRLMTRDSCSFTRAGYVVKDLRIFKDKDLNKIVLVDNLAKCSLPQLDNAIPVLPFINDENDNELDELASFLVKLTSESNIPAYLKRYFKFHRYPASPSHNHLLDEILNKVV